MFNGIIKHTGKIVKIIKKKNNCTLSINSKMKFYNNELGSSISCSGTCLTLGSYKKNISHFYLSRETLNRTIFKHARVNDVVNLEKSLRFGTRISGHFVMGHIDATCNISNLRLIGKSWSININLPRKYQKLIAEKGSIAINGVSLTISKIFKNKFEIVVIPQTLKYTNLINIKKNDRVNVEFDVFAKYINNSLK